MSSMLTITLPAVLTGFTVVWAIAHVTRRMSVVDIFWGPGFAAIACLSLQSGTTAAATDFSPTGRTALLLLLICLWATRLCAHLFVRWVREGREDRRYAAMRERHARGFLWKSLLLIFWLQAIVMWFVSLPLQFACQTQRDLQPEGIGSTALLLVGLLCWMIGMVFETAGDWQLARFMHNPSNSGKVLKTGVWRWTRHPNYFGDSMVWWGFWLVAAACGSPLWTIVSPVLMTFLLIRVSGVGLLEKDIGNRRPEYADYIRTTSAFLPWPPRAERRSEI
ncbi:MAG: DUF1295 domain-containing protein [Planctomycetaceae bacterium]|nr:DUF1295 domain-containing protein [Planctomycetaceae bacterium]